MIPRSRKISHKHEALWPEIRATALIMQKCGKKKQFLSKNGLIIDAYEFVIP